MPVSWPRIDDPVSTLKRLRSLVLDPKSQVLDLKSQVLDLKAQVLDLKSQVLELKSQVLDIGSQFLDRAKPLVFYFAHEDWNTVTESKSCF